MKNALVQIYVSLDGYTFPDWIPQSDEISKISILSAKKYAKRIGADHFLLTDPYINFLHPTYERFRLFEQIKWTQEYSQVLYLDSDVFCYQQAPNIFEMYSDTDSFKVCQHWSEYKFAHKGMKHGFNAGVFILTDTAKQKMLPYLNYRIDPPYKYHDNEALAKCVEQSNVKTTEMSALFNAKNYEDGYFCHVWGGAKRRQPNMPCIEKAKKEIQNINN